MAELQAVRPVSTNETTSPRSLLTNFKRLLTLKAPTHEPKLLSRVESTTSSVYSTAQDSTVSSQTTAASSILLEPVHELADEQIFRSPEANPSALVDIGDGFFATPTVAISQDLVDTWVIDIRPRLWDEVCVKLGRQCQLEFCMVREKSGKERPYIILQCWDERLQKAATSQSRIRKSVQKQVNQFQSLRNCQFPTRVIFDKALLIGLMIPDGSVKIFAAPVKNTAETHLAPALISRRTYSCTMGGLVLADDDLFGLTVAHPFVHDDVMFDLEYKPSDTLGTATIFDQIFDSPSDDDLSDMDDEDTIRTSQSSSNPETPATKTPESADIGPLSKDPYGIELEVKGNIARSLSPPPDGEYQRGVIHDVCYLRADAPRSSGQIYSSDWALVDLTWPSDPEPVFIDRARASKLQYVPNAHIAPGLQVNVNLFRDGHLAGQLGQTNLDLHLDGLRLKVTQVVLTTSLSIGNSGSWVYAGEDVLGQIVATRMLAPIAYMVSMESILADIELKHHLKAISLSAVTPVLFPWQCTQNSADSDIEDSTTSLSESTTTEPYEQTQDPSVKQQSHDMALADPALSGMELADLSNLAGLPPGFRLATDDQDLAKRHLTDLSHSEHHLGAGLKSIINLKRSAPVGAKVDAGYFSSRSRTIKDVIESLAVHKQQIISIPADVELDALEGWKSRAAAQPASFKSPPTSYYFPPESDMPNWRPFTLSRVYISALGILAITLAYFQTYYANISRGNEALEHVSFVSTPLLSSSTSMQTAWPYISTIAAIIYAAFFSAMDIDLCRLEPYYRLSQRNGSSSVENLELQYSTSSLYRRLRHAVQLRHWIVTLSTIGFILASIVVPVLQSMAFSYDIVHSNKCLDGEACFSEPQFYVLKVKSFPSLLTTISYLVIAVLTLTILLLQRRRKSGLLCDPGGIARLLAMTTKSHILQDFRNADVATTEALHKRLSHRFYTLWQGSLWQGEYQPESSPLTIDHHFHNFYHPSVLKSTVIVPLLFFCFCFTFLVIPLARSVWSPRVSDKASWLPLAAVIVVRYIWSQVDMNIRLLEPYYQLSQGNARPEDSLTLDYQPIPHGYLPLFAAFKGHFLVALTSLSSMCLDVLCVIATLFSTHLKSAHHYLGQKPVGRVHTVWPIWVVVVLLSTVIFTALCISRYRRKAFLPRTPSSIASVLAYTYSSKLVVDLIGTEGMTSEQLESKLKASGKRYSFGWFKGRDGEFHCGIDEEPRATPYSHGTSYNMATVPSMTSYEFV